MRAKVFILTAALCVAFAGLAMAQGSSIVGSVSDDEGGVLPGVSITVVNTGTGLTRVTTTSNEGRFNVGSLVPGTYKVTASIGGFADTVVEEIDVIVGRSVPVTIAMSPATERTITVTGTRPIIEPTESDISTAIPQELIDTLPIAERNAITLALLAPGVSGAPYFDPTKSRDNFDGVSFAGNSGSENLVLVDGADNNDDVVGSILQFYPQDSIQEFEIITSRFKAEYGHTDGGVLNMVTKSGTNTLSGGGYWLFRDDSLNSKTFVEEEANLDKPEFRQNIVGGYIGGPIAEDRAHFFANIDYTERPATITTFTGGLLPEVDAQGSLAQGFDQTLFVGKVTSQLNQDNFLMGRYAYQDDSTENVNLTSRDTIEHGGLGSNEYHAFLAKLQTVLGGDKLNEVFWQVNDFTNQIESNAVGTPRERIEIIAGDSALGHNINHPQLTEQTKHQIVDNFSWRSFIKGDHDFKAGVEYQRVEVGGQFSTGMPFAHFIYDTEADFLAGRPATEVDIFNGPLFDVGESYNDVFALYLQDDWHAGERLSLNLGIRWDVETNDWTQKNRTFVSADPLFFGAQPDTDWNNFGPRIGFAYDVEGNGRTIARGGYGLFYQQIFWNSPIRTAFLEGEALGFIALGAPAFGPTDPFCAAPDINPGGCISFPSVPGANAAEFVGRNFTGTLPNLKTPYSHQFSMGMSTLLPGDWGLDVDYVHSRSDNQIFLTRIAGRDAIDGFDTSNMGVRGRVNTQGAEMRYNGLLASLRKRFADITAQVSYTFGRGEGHIPRQTSALIDDMDFERNFGPHFGQRDHLFAGSLTYDLPYEIQIGGIVKLQSGYSFTAIDPLLGDVDGDLATNDSIAAGQNRGGERGDSFAQMDLRFAKMFTIADRFRPQVFIEVFNIFNTENQKPESVANTVGGEGFGDSTAVAGQFRQAQFSVRLDF